MSNNNFNILDEYLDFLLSEAPKVTTPSIVTRASKIKRVRGQLSSVEGRKRNDPLYQRMVRYREMYYKYKQMLHQKYSPRVQRKAR